jgi:hypothetical protein
MTVDTFHYCGHTEGSMTHIETCNSHRWSDENIPRQPGFQEPCTNYEVRRIEQSGICRACGDSLLTEAYDRRHSWMTDREEERRREEASGVALRNRHFVFFPKIGNRHVFQAVLQSGDLCIIPSPNPLEGEETQECLICHRVLAQGEDIIRLSCTRHCVFHRAFILEWWNLPTNLCFYCRHRYIWTRIPPGTDFVDDSFLIGGFRAWITLPPLDEDETPSGNEALAEDESSAPSPAWVQQPAQQQAASGGGAEGSRVAHGPFPPRRRRHRPSRDRDEWPLA